MTQESAGTPMDEEEHPVLLPWHAAGTLDAWTARRIDEHLVGCAECRIEIEALKSMATTLQRHHGTDHVEVVDLVGYEHDEPALPADRRESILQHLSGCATCTDEIEILRSVRREVPGLDMPASAAPRPATLGPERSERWKWAFYAAAAITVALVLPAVRGLRKVAVPPGPGPIQQVRLMAATRGDEFGPALVGLGPWALEIVLPFGAPDGEYEVRIAPHGGAQDAVVSVRVRAASDGRLSLYLPVLPDAGAFDLTAASQSETGKTYGYTFTRATGGSKENKGPLP